MNLNLISFQGFRLIFDFLHLKFVACSKPLSLDIHREAAYVRTPQRDQGTG